MVGNFPSRCIERVRVARLGTARGSQKRTGNISGLTRQDSVDSNSSSCALVDRAECFRVNLFGGDVLAFEVGLYVCHEAYRST